MRWTIPTAVFEVWPDWVWKITNTVLEDRTQETLNWVWLSEEDKSALNKYWDSVSQLIEMDKWLLTSNSMAQNIERINLIFSESWIGCHRLDFKIWEINFEWKNSKNFWILKILAYLLFYANPWVTLWQFLDLLWEKWKGWDEWYEFVKPLSNMDRNTSFEDLFKKWYIGFDRFNLFYSI